MQALFSYGVAWFLLFGGLRPVVELARSQRRDRRRWRGGVSDADQLARLTGVPGGVWVCLFALVALVAIVVGARLLVPASVHVPLSAMRAPLVRGVVVDVRGVVLDVGEALTCLGFVGARDQHLNTMELQLRLPSSGVIR